MLPDKPIMWFVVFVIVIFITHTGLNVALGISESLLITALWSVVTGVFMIGLMYLADEVRARLFNDG